MPVRRYNHDAEEIVCGCCIIGGGEAYARIADIVTAADFDHPGLAVVFEAIEWCDANAKPITIDAVSYRLRDIDRLNTIGSNQFLNDLTDRVSTTAWLEFNATVVAEMSGIRKARLCAEEIIGKTEDTTADYEAVMEFAGAKAMEITQGRMADTMVSLAGATEEAMTKLMTAVAGQKKITGLETGYRDLDKLLAGLHDGQLIVVAARPAMGKTSLVMCICEHVVEHAGPALFFSLEMPRIELANRMIARRARVDQSLLRSLEFQDGHIEELTAAANEIFNLPLYIDDAGGLTIGQCRAKARRFKQKHPDLKLIVIDYLQLMKSAKLTQSREQEISEISRGLKELAKELQVPIVALSQLNRAPETRPGKDRRPQLSDLRESGAIEQDSDVVIFIYRDEMYNRDTEDKGVAEIIVAKQRNGPTDTARLRWIRELTSFENLAEDENEKTVSMLDPAEPMGARTSRVVPVPAARGPVDPGDIPDDDFGAL